MKRGAAWRFYVSLFTFHISRFFFRRQFARFVFEHDGDAVLDQVGEAAGLADQLIFGFPEHQRPFAQRANQNIEQFAVHLFSQFPQYQFAECRIDFGVDPQHPVLFIGE